MVFLKQRHDERLLLAHVGGVNLTDGGQGELGLQAVLGILLNRISLQVHGGQLLGILELVQIPEVRDLVIIALSTKEN